MPKTFPVRRRGSLVTLKVLPRLKLNNGMRKLEFVKRTTSESQGRGDVNQPKVVVAADNILGMRAASKCKPKSTKRKQLMLMMRINHPVSFSVLLISVNNCHWTRSCVSEACNNRDNAGAYRLSPVEVSCREYILWLQVFLSA